MGKVTKKEKSLKGLGFNILLNQILSCSKYGITHIEGKAERSMDMNGYYTWARYGFDGQIPLSNIVFKKFTSILDIMSTANGRKLWEYLGFTFNAKFDLNKNSKNIKMFHRYLEEENGKNKDT